MDFDKSNRCTVTVLCLVLALQSGCVAWQPLPFVKKSPPELPEHYKHYYDYPKTEYPAQIVGQWKKKGYTLRRLEFPLSLLEGSVVKDFEAYKKYVEDLAKTDEKTANDLKLLYTNRVDYYIPDDLKAGERRPAIVISSILGGTMVVDHFAKFYARRGFVAVIVHRKRPWWDDEKEMAQIEDHMRRAVIGLRQVVDWLGGQKEVDINRIGAFGISYGAVLHSVLAAVEPRIRYHILAMPGGRLADVIIDCPDKAITKLIKQVHELRGWSKDEMHERLRREIVTDPIYLAPYVDKTKVQIYIALFDRVVGSSRSFDLWKAMEKPKLKIIPFGHYGGIVLLPYLQLSSYLAFKRRL